MFEYINGVYYPCENEVVDELPVGIYTLNYNRRNYKVEAKHNGEKFKVPKKTYCLDERFINRVLDTFGRRGTNLGVLMNGYKGSGKSVTAKIICNRLDLPVFVMNEKLDADDIQVFINALQQDCVLFIDEYEKVFGRDGELLTLMDGSLNLKNNILFLLTSNEMDVNQNLFNRPSRVFFIKQFGGLEESEIAEILDDYLEKPVIREEIVSLIKSFEEVTIDNIMLFLEEVNYANTADLGDILKHLNIRFRPQKAGFRINRL